MSPHTIRLLQPGEVDAWRTDLVDLLVDSVASGASVNFIWPMTEAKSQAWWTGALASHAAGERLIFIAERDGRLDGMVHLVPAPQENQPFRADIAKMLVHTRARRQGVGAALLRAAEAEASRLGRILLTLDTETGSAGEDLYTALGWTKFGQVPGFALTADGSRREAASFFYKEL